MNKTIKIRKAKITDFIAIAALDRIAWLDNKCSEFIPDGEHVWRIWVEHALVYCAENNDGDIVAAILAFPTQQNSYCVHKVFVAKEFKAKGIGSKLFACLLKALDSLSVTSFLTVDPENSAAIALYKKWGYTSSVLVKGYYRPEEDRLVLTRLYHKHN